jgi:drug/metabolite transporter (DMT)-like permease
MLFDWILWMTVPGLRLLIGASIIVASGLYVIHRERIKVVSKRSSGAPPATR